MTRLAILRGEGHHRQPTWGGHADCCSVVDTLNTNKREGRCLAANITPICLIHIKLRLEKASTNPVFYFFLLNNFNHSSISSEDNSLSPEDLRFDGSPLIGWKNPLSWLANSSDEATSACTV